MLKHLFFILLFCACAKLDYVIEQGAGQMMLQNKSRRNKDVLRDKKVPQEYKNKILKIEQYKKYFYEYFGEEQKNIYSRTTILKNQAVTYLVIASKKTEIKAHNTCFVVMGCFPYLGFFDPESADKYIAEMEAKDYVTYKRPVYAYSTLGFFEDTILSSFFQYDDFDLAELIFHELFHTIFFAKNEVDLNEALASYFGFELAKLYFSLDPLKSKMIDQENERRNELNKFLVQKADELNHIYSGEKDLSAERANYLLDKFLNEKLYPEVRSLCANKKMSDDECFPLKIKWNNASFAAYMTYERDIDFIKLVREKLNLDLKAYLALIKEQYQRYLKESHPDEESFALYLMRINNISK